MSETNRRVAIITGGSQGIGLVHSRLASPRGSRLHGPARCRCFAPVKALVEP